MLLLLLVVPLLLLSLLLLTFFATSIPTMMPIMARMMSVMKKQIQRFLRYPRALTLALSSCSRLEGFCELNVYEQESTLTLQ